MPVERFTRGNLPHWFVPGAFIFVTYRLFGTIPLTVIDELEGERARLVRAIPPDVPQRDARHRINKILFAKYDAYLDAGTDIDWLRNPSVAKLVKDAIHFMRRKGFTVHCFSIMPNHVHLLIRGLEPNSSPDRNPLTKLMQDHKSFTGRQANALLGRSGHFWQDESYDHWVRDEQELENIVAYINGNPAKAGLCMTPVEWPWSSAAERFAMDGDTSGWLDEP